MSGNDDNPGLVVLAVDDEPGPMAMLLEVLEAEPRIGTVMTATNATEALTILRPDSRSANGTPLPRVDVVFLDIRMPGLDGLAVLDIVRRRNPDVKVVLLSAYAEPRQIQEAFDRGATAYIIKSVNPLDLPSALRQAFEGTVYSAVTGCDNAAPNGKQSCGLTERELAILRAVANGLSNKAISKEMWVTEQTVKFHLTNIYRKLGVHNRTAAARYAHSEGLLDA
jgi:DNA-binding NarL/FixJ family response regulator